ncbi:MAG TPA: penicillin-binding protein 2 [Candidatus Dormibacteraeota bacterium]|nr:penicillin-binding protein 2 [Candidatus Dormibacteraeota bacterium]
MASNDNQIVGTAAKRVRISYGLLLLMFAIFGLRLFYVQVIRYDYYKTAALSDQLKQYQIPAERGIIKAYDGDTIVPIVLNQHLYTLYADPVYISNPSKVAADVQRIIGGDVKQYAAAMQQKGTRYVVLGNRISQDQQARVVNLKDPGLGTIAQDYRTYPQGTLASQLLGFVNNDGVGEYGIEQALNNQLKGAPGQLKAITDSNGVPLAASKNNIERAPVKGNDLVLTIDIGMQQQLETILKDEAQQTKADSASVVVMDPNNGAIKAMANYPTYDPSQFYNVSDPSLFNNGTVNQPIEVGSIMKTLTTSAALDQGVIKPDSTYYDPAQWLVDGFDIHNIAEDGGPGNRSIADLLNLSLNTGATWELMQMGGGQLDAKGRNIWHDYMVNHFLLGKPTGIEQGYEASGYIPSPTNNGAGINLTYANTAFGQAVTITPIQMAAALSAVLNGGTYYQPHLVDQQITADGKIYNQKPVILKQHVVGPQVGPEMIPLMQFVVEHHYIVPQFDQTKYIVGGKTGTAQIAKPGGGYYNSQYNGTYIGFVGGDKVQYVIVVYVIKPKNGGYAGTAAAQPIFARMAHVLIDQSYVTPKTH